MTNRRGRRRIENEQLFDPGEKVPLPKKFGSPRLPVWTRSKTRLIEQYMRHFQLVTKHGTYIDGFAGPQYPDIDNEYSAKLVVEIKPERLRHFYLFDLGDEQFDILCKLRDAHPDRDIQVRQGDFNSSVGEVLRADVLRPTEATFCLLDQRTFECHWSTVRQLADYKRDQEHKIELFYFFANWWLDRALASTTRDTSKIQAWWGRDDWPSILSWRRSQRIRSMRDRFQHELGYKFVQAWAIYGAETGGPTRVMYYMIHASDHPAAANLMSRAYKEAVQHRHSDQLKLKF